LEKLSFKEIGVNGLNEAEPAIVEVGGTGGPFLDWAMTGSTKSMGFPQKQRQFQWKWGDPSIVAYCGGKWNKKEVCSGGYGRGKMIL